MVSHAAATNKTTSRASALLGGVLAVVGCNLVGILGALFTTTDSAWYQALTKPSFQPPGWLFGPMWTLLYTLMGVALYRVVARRARPGAKGALALFGAQLFLNGIWSPIFFGAQAIGVAAVVIVLLFVLIALTLWRFLSVDRTAAFLLIPYLAWVGFAAVLNVTILTLN